MRASAGACIYNPALNPTPGCRWRKSGFVIIDDFVDHPLLPQMEAAARSITALCNAKVDLSLDTSRSYVHRASEQRGESRGTQWTGTPHVFRGEEAWAIRGLLHPDWKEFVELQPVFAEFLSSPEVLSFLRHWSDLTPEQLTMTDATLFVNPREAHFSEGWYTDALLACACAPSHSPHSAICRG